MKICALVHTDSISSVFSSVFSYLLVTIKSIQSFCGSVPSLEYSANASSFRLDCILSSYNKYYTKNTGTEQAG